MSALSEIDPSLHITPIDSELLQQGQRYLDSLTKPLGSLGRLEVIARRLFAIGGGRRPLRVAPARMYTVAADHGIARKGVSAYPQSVTREMVENFLQGGGAINVLCKENGLNLFLVDAGCVGGPFPAHPMLLDRRINEGTKDISEEAAMTREEALTCLRTGIDLARDAAKRGIVCLGTGEMGIGNTTPATALFCAVLGLDPHLVTGPGTGINAKTLLFKVTLIEKALSLHASAIDRNDYLGILAALGGFEIAVMSGIMLGAASETLPFLVDGFIASSAYIVARAFAPAVEDYAFLTHASAEPGYQAVMQRIGEKPLLDFGLRLGEGTGAALAYPLLRSAAAIFSHMATFQTAHVSGALGGK